MRAFEWSPDGTQIAFLAPEPMSEEEEARQEAKDDARDVDEDDLPQLRLVDIEARTVSQLTEGQRRISEFAWVPPGQTIILSGTDDPQPELETNKLYLLDVDTDDFEMLSEPPRPFGDLQVSPGGRLVACVATRVDGPTTHDLWVLDLEGGSTRKRYGRVSRPPCRRVPVDLGPQTGGNAGNGVHERNLHHPHGR